MNRIIYQLTIEDVQGVAENELGHKLSSEEIQFIAKEIETKISWYDIIAEAFLELPKQEKEVSDSF